MLWLAGTCVTNDFSVAGMHFVVQLKWWFPKIKLRFFRVPINKILYMGDIRVSIKCGCFFRDPTIQVIVF